MKLIQKFSENRIGTDYIVGDIHGEFLFLENKLKEINFNTNTDRLFATGDLCDRGAHSKEVLKWIGYDWFYSVLGNHEDIFLNVVNKTYSEEIITRVGGEWYFDLEKEEKEILYLKFGNFPLSIEIEVEQKKIGIVHAACPYSDWSRFQDKIVGVNQDKIKRYALWTYRKNLDDINEVIKNIDYVVVGHSKVSEVIKNGNTWYLDTGSGYKDTILTIKKLVDLI